VSKETYEVLPLVVAFCPTTVIRTINGVRARLWLGNIIPGDQPINAWVFLLGAEGEEGQNILANVLEEVAPPTVGPDASRFK
jgi:hypothetical protein